jgi:hypothetical protein
MNRRAAIVIICFAAVVTAVLMVPGMQPPIVLP